jgi:hypothetical protein
MAHSAEPNHFTMAHSAEPNHCTMAKRKSSQIFIIRLHFAQWPISQNQICCSGPEYIIEFTSVTHRTERHLKSNMLANLNLYLNCFRSGIRVLVGYFWWDHFSQEISFYCHFKGQLREILTSAYFYRKNPLNLLTSELRQLQKYCRRNMPRYSTLKGLPPVGHCVEPNFVFANTSNLKLWWQRHWSLLFICLHFLATLSI